MMFRHFTSLCNTPAAWTLSSPPSTRRLSAIPASPAMSAIANRRPVISSIHTAINDICADFLLRMRGSFPSERRSAS